MSLTKASAPLFREPNFRAKESSQSACKGLYPSEKRCRACCVDTGNFWGEKDEDLDPENFVGCSSPAKERKDYVDGCMRACAK